MNATLEKIFVYGTLCDPKIRKKILGRDVLKIADDNLDGFKMSSISDEGFCYPILVKEVNSKELIKGEIFEVTTAEMQILDKYEGDLYVRVEYVLNSGTKAWVYVQPDGN